MVPLSKSAIAILMQMKGIDELNVFCLKPSILESLVRKAKKMALNDGLHFHDTRREAMSRFAAKVEVMTLVKISGHKVVRILQSAYSAPDMGDVAVLLD